MFSFLAVFAGLSALLDGLTLERHFEFELVRVISSTMDIVLSKGNLTPCPSSTPGMWKACFSYFVCFAVICALVRASAASFFSGDFVWRSYIRIQWELLRSPRIRNMGAKQLKEWWFNFSRPFFLTLGFYFAAYLRLYVLP